MQKLKGCCKAWLKIVKELWQMKHFNTVFSDKICFDDVTFLWVTHSESAVFLPWACSTSPIPLQTVAAGSSGIAQSLSGKPYLESTTPVSVWSGITTQMQIKISMLFLCQMTHHIFTFQSLYQQDVTMLDNFCSADSSKNTLPVAPICPQEHL